MTPIDARLIRLIMERPPVFSSFAELGVRLGPSVGFVEIGVSANNLQRLGLVDAGTPKIVDDLVGLVARRPEGLDDAIRRGPSRRGDKVFTGNDGTTSAGHTLRVRYRLTELGLTFLFVVRPPR